MEMKYIAKEFGRQQKIRDMTMEHSGALPLATALA
jgi:hypothetical protein